MLMLTTTWVLPLKNEVEFEEAIEAYNKALAIQPDYLPLTAIWVLPLQTEVSRKRRNAYNKSLSIKPDDAEVHYNMGAALQSKVS